MNKGLVPQIPSDNQDSLISEIRKLKYPERFKLLRVLVWAKAISMISTAFAGICLLVFLWNKFLR